MNFFEHQEQARHNTKKLVWLFILAVITLITITSAFISAVIYHSQGGGADFSQQQEAAEHFARLPQWLNPEIFMLTAACVIGTVIVGSLFKWMQLSAGGKAVAEAMGGRQIQHNTDHRGEKKILNIVEEMAIASGLPVPAVFILDSSAINAFAAGHNHHDAIIGVTQGCIDLLDRDQLQGVIAHEFSHILHGDMSLNMRLVGVLHGILAISLIGSLLLHSGRPRHRHGFNRRSSNNKGSGIALAGLGLLVIGYVGNFFGNLIKANVSRQREFLADASAVQFTRNPDGIGQALKKIGGFSHGSQLNTASTEEFSHLFFGEVSHFNSWMATHPPLPERITRILPQWSGEYPEVAAPAMTEDNTAQATSSFSGTSQTVSPTSEQPSAIDSIGVVSTAQLNKARQLLSDIPGHLKDAAGDPFSARAVIYSLLMKDSQNLEGIQNVQWQQLKENCHPVVYRHTTQLYKAVQKLPTELMLPLFESCLASLKTLSAPQYQVFRKNVMLLIRADKKVSVFEWCLYRMLINNLEAKQLSARSINLKQANNACEDLLSNLCLLGHKTPKAAETAFHKAAGNLTFKLNYVAQQGPHFQHIDQALQTLRRVKPLQKPQLLKTLAIAIEHDGKVTLAEQELFRAIADNLDCPVPPLQAGQTLR